MRQIKKLGTKPQQSAEPDPLDADSVKRADEILRKLGPFGNLLIYNLLIGAIGGNNEQEKKALPLITASVKAILRNINPVDAIEEMAAAQMVAMHFGAMACMKRALQPDQTFHGYDLNLKYASKLSLGYAQLVDALNKHRGKGQQKVTVEHVHVESGGQAMVGNIASAGEKQRPDAKTDETPKSLSFAPGTTLDMKEAVKVPVKQSSE